MHRLFGKAGPACALALLLGVVVSDVSHAQVPPLINYQGVLEEDGQPVSGDTTLVFRLFDAIEGDGLLWEETRDVTVVDGVLNVLLGEDANNPIPTAQLAGLEELYLEIQVGAQSLERLRIASVPYALQAARADSAAGVPDEAAVTRLVAGDSPSDAAVLTGPVTIRGEGGAIVQREEGTNTIVINAGSGAAETPIQGLQTPEGDPSITIISPGGPVPQISVSEGGITANKLATPEPPAAGTVLGYDGTSLVWTTPGASSLRWKESVRAIENPLGLVEALRGVRYRWTADGREDLGLIAEEVGGVLPELVQYEANGRDARAVDYAKLVAVLIEATKQQQQHVETLEQQVDTLEAANRRLLARMARLEAAVQQATPASEDDPRSAQPTRVRQK